MTKVRNQELFLFFFSCLERNEELTWLLRCLHSQMHSRSLRTQTRQPRTMMMPNSPRVPRLQSRRDRSRPMPSQRRPLPESGNPNSTRMENRKRSARGEVAPKCESLEPSSVPGYLPCPPQREQLLTDFVACTRFSGSRRQGGVPSRRGREEGKERKGTPREESGERGGAIDTRALLIEHSCPRSVLPLPHASECHVVLPSAVSLVPLCQNKMVRSFLVLSSCTCRSFRTFLALTISQFHPLFCQ